MYEGVVGWRKHKNETYILAYSNFNHKTKCTSLHLENIILLQCIVESQFYNVIHNHVMLENVCVSS